MSQAEDLLISITGNEVNTRTVNPDVEEHIVIGDDRFISVPEALKRIAVQYDHDVETVTFDCPRYWDGIDMSGMKVYINYQRPNKTLGMYLAKNVVIDENNPDILHFDWTISSNVTETSGRLSFLVCIKKTDADGNEKNHWNSELNSEMYISEGLECGEVITKQNADIITDLLTRMDYVEIIATPENMQGYVSNYLNNDETLQQTVADHIIEYLEDQEPTSPEAMAGYVENYLDDHPPIFVIGPNKPGVKCIWFDTSDSDETEDNVVIPMAPESAESVYAEVGDTVTTDFDFDIN